jgi:hypothetical protein
VVNLGSYLGYFAFPGGFGLQLLKLYLGDNMRLQISRLDLYFLVRAAKLLVLAKCYSQEFVVWLCVFMIASLTW